MKNLSKLKMIGKKNEKIDNKLGLSCAKLRISWSELTHELLMKIDAEFNGNITEAGWLAVLSIQFFPPVHCAAYLGNCRPFTN